MSSDVMQSLHRRPETLDEYERWQDTVKKQRQEATSGTEIKCICGKRVRVENMYRCFFCNIYLCYMCGERHFGPRDKHTSIVGVI